MTESLFYERLNDMAGIFRPLRVPPFRQQIGSSGVYHRWSGPTLGT